MSVVIINSSPSSRNSQDSSRPLSSPISSNNRAQEIGRAFAPISPAPLSEGRVVSPIFLSPIPEEPYEMRFWNESGDSYQLYSDSDSDSSRSPSPSDLSSRNSRSPSPSSISISRDSTPSSDSLGSREETPHAHGRDSVTSDSSSSSKRSSQSSPSEHSQSSKVMAHHSKHHHRHHGVRHHHHHVPKHKYEPRLDHNEFVRGELANQGGYLGNLNNACSSDLQTGLILMSEGAMQNGLKGLGSPEARFAHFVEWQNKFASLMSSDSIDQEKFAKLLNEGFTDGYLNEPIRERPFNGETVLHYLSKSDRFAEAFSHLDDKLTVEKSGVVGHVFNPSEKGQLGYTPIMWAIHNSSNSMAMQLLQSFPKGKNYLNVHSEVQKNCALHLAVVKNGYHKKSNEGSTIKDTLALVQELARKGAKVNAKNIYGNTPLHLACARRDTAMIKALLAAGANPSLKNSQGKRPQELLELEHQEANQLLQHNVECSFSLHKSEFDQNKQACLSLFSKK